MPAGRNLPEEAERLLAQYPGPMTIYRSMLSRAFLAVCGTLFLLMGLFFLLLFAAPSVLAAIGLILQPPKNGGWERILSGAILSLPLFAFGAAFFAAAFFRSSGRLRLHQEGFDFDVFVWKRRYFWTAAADFTTFAGILWFRNPAIPKNSRRIRDSWLITNRIFLNNFDLPAGELAKLMNAWRERALAQQNEGTGP